MDLRLLEIASHTENNKVIENFTHKSKHKNPLCGDEMEISLIVKNDTVIDMGYQCKSCVYCQASVSLLSQKIKNKTVSPRPCLERRVVSVALGAPLSITQFSVAETTLRSPPRI